MDEYTLLELYYLIITAATFVIFALDKAAALNRTWRTSELTLHLLRFQKVLKLNYLNIVTFYEF
jgi:uncharacterized membrane protein YsdA (DUF1294 family)